MQFKNWTLSLLVQFLTWFKISAPLTSTCASIENSFMIGILKILVYFLNKSIYLKIIFSYMVEFCIFPKCAISIEEETWLPLDVTDLCIIFHWRSEFGGFIKENYRKSELEKS